MTFSEGGSFEGGRVSSRRGGAIAGGGAGLLGIVGFLIYQFTGVNVGPALESLEGAGGGGQQQESVIEDCTAEEANTQRDCRLSATIQSLDAFWSEEVTAAGGQFAQPQVVEFQQGTTTGCGEASSSTGPFYCPPDQGIYIDLGFYDLLQSRFGAAGGPLPEMYVTAHEYGHHIQNITGVMASADRGGAGADSDSVRIELQADCYAGMWTRDAVTRVDPDTGTVFLQPITDDQLADALSAAAAVGDDHIQQQSGGGVDPHTWTHGSSEQRQNWFATGYNEGSLAACDTFAANDL